MYIIHTHITNSYVITCMHEVTLSSNTGQLRGVKANKTVNKKSTDDNGNELLRTVGKSCDENGSYKLIEVKMRNGT